MSLSAELEKYKAAFIEKAPQEIQNIMATATENLTASGILDTLPKVGDTLTGFSLPDHNSQQTESADLLKKGPLVITFYRGGWCPYCNLELKAYQDHLSEIHKLGANLVAITPELPDSSLSTIEKNQLEFLVLSDTQSNYAKALGVVFSLAEELRPIYKNFGIDLEKHNGSGQFELPIPVTLVVDQEGIIRYISADTDYTVRPEPKAVIELLQTLNN